MEKELIYQLITIFKKLIYNDMQRNYTVGERCDKCGTPTIQGAKGAYCKPCYIAYKNGQQASAASNYAPKPTQATQTRPPEDITTVLGKCKTLFLVEAFKMQMPLAKAEPLAEEWARASMRILPKTTAQSFNVDNMMPKFAESSGFVGRAETDVQLPTIQQDEEISIATIPF